MPPAGDVTYKEDTSSNINKNISTRYGGATSYIPYDQYGNKIVDLPSEEELKKLKEAQQGSLDIFENEEDRIEKLGFLRFAPFLAPLVGGKVLSAEKVRELLGLPDTSRVGGAILTEYQHFKI